MQLPNGNVGARVNYDDKEVVLSMEQILAMQLLKLQQIVQAANDGVPAADCVLSVPTWYTDAQRRAMLVCVCASRDPATSASPPSQNSSHLHAYRAGRR